MSEYWLISAPGDKTCQQTWETMNNLTNKQNNLCVNYKFHIPDLKVGTLDQLVGLSDDLGKLDTYVEQITRKVASYLGEVLEDQRDKLHENLLANNSPDPPSAPPDYMQNTQLKNCNEQTNNNNNNCNNNNNTNQKKLNFIKNRIDTQTTITTTTTTESSIQTTTTLTTICPACRRKSFNNSIEFEERDYFDGLCNCDNNSSFSNKNHNNVDVESEVFGSEIFDWWFARHKRGSHKSRSRSSSQINITSGVSHRSSPVSSCCGSSQGRSSPDIEIDDLGEPPPMPLSPADLPTYITRFQWDMAKYPIKQSLRNIADIISKQVGQIDADLKTKSTAYNNLKGNLQNLEKKQTGSLMTRNLADLVKKDHFILDSEYLTTLLVIVPKPLANDWSNNYEKISTMIVPRSSTLIEQDAEYCLFNVHLFKKVVEEFKLHARERKFVVRDFVYNEEELAAGKNEITKLVTDKKKQFGPLVRWLKVNFSECFCAWIHVKALRVFVESVLRYGLPVNFQAILIQPHKKSIKRLRDQLNHLYGHLDGSSSGGGGSGAHNTDLDIPGLGFGASEYYPYVYYKLGIDMVDSK